MTYSYGITNDDCPACDGYGYVGAFDCDTCEGTGVTSALEAAEYLERR